MQLTLTDDRLIPTSWWVLPPFLETSLLTTFKQDYSSNTTFPHGWCPRATGWQSASALHPPPSAPATHAQPQPLHPSAPAFATPRTVKHTSCSACLLQKWLFPPHLQPTFPQRGKELNPVLRRQQCRVNMGGPSFHTLLTLPKKHGEAGALVGQVILVLEWEGSSLCLPSLPQDLLTDRWGWQGDCFSSRSLWFLACRGWLLEADLGAHSSLLHSLAFSAVLPTGFIRWLWISLMTKHLCCRPGSSRGGNQPPSCRLREQEVHLAFRFGGLVQGVEGTLPPVYPVLWVMKLITLFLIWLLVCVLNDLKIGVDEGHVV